MEVQVKKLIRYTYAICLFSIFFMKSKPKRVFYLVITKLHDVKKAYPFHLMDKLYRL